MAFRMNLILAYISICILMQYRANARTLEQPEVIQTFDNLYFTN
jgi:hypothetical protein